MAGWQVTEEAIAAMNNMATQLQELAVKIHQETEKNDKPVTILSVIRRRNDVQLDLNQIDLIRAALKNTSNKQQFYNYFAKKLGQKKGIELYHSIKSSYTDLMNANLI